MEWRPASDASLGSHCRLYLLSYFPGTPSVETHLRAIELEKCGSRSSTGASSRREVTEHYDVVHGGYDRQTAPCEYCIPAAGGNVSGSATYESVIA